MKSEIELRFTERRRALLTGITNTMPKKQITENEPPNVSGTYLTTAESAYYLKLSRQFLEGARYRADGSGPPFIKLERAVRYRKSALDAWMAAHDHAPDKPL